MHVSSIRTRGEKILFPIAVVFSAFVWLALIFGMVSSFATKPEQPPQVMKNPEPCVYLNQDFYYFMSQEEAAKHPAEITCLAKEEVPPDIYYEATEKLKTAAVKESAPKQKVNPVGATSAVILLYVLLFFLFIYVTTALAMAFIRLNGVKISKTQYPAFYKIYEETAHALGLKKIPDAYIIHTGGAINAFAIKITRKKMVVFYADLIENLAEGHKLDELHAVAAHELTHVFLKHINYWLFLTPFKLLPFMSPLLSRMRETSADRGALMITKNHDVVSQALVKLATGKFVAEHVNIDEYVEQLKTERGIFIALAKLIASHPPIPQRIGYLRKITN